MDNLGCYEQYRWFLSDRFSHGAQSHLTEPIFTTEENLGNPF